VAAAEGWGQWVAEDPVAAARVDQRQDSVILLPAVRPKREGELHLLDREAHLAVPLQAQGDSGLHLLSLLLPALLAQHHPNRLPFKLHRSQQPRVDSALPSLLLPDQLAVPRLLPLEVCLAADPLRLLPGEAVDLLRLLRPRQEAQQGLLLPVAEEVEVGVVVKVAVKH